MRRVPAVTSMSDARFVCAFECACVVIWYRLPKLLRRVLALKFLRDARFVCTPVRAFAIFVHRWHELARRVSTPIFTRAIRKYVAACVRVLLRIVCLSLRAECSLYE